MKREVEIKYLLDSQVARNKLINSLKQLYPEVKKIKDSIVISYFYKKPKRNIQVLKAAARMLNDAEYESLRKLLEDSSELTVRARSIDNDVFLAVKGAAIGEDAVHAVNRIEFEVKINNSLEEVNDKLTTAGIELASKWYSERSFYKLNEKINMDVEFVSGYGYKAELEIMVDDEDSQAAELEIRDIARKLSLQEASQELLGNMYEYYNQHWQMYFKTNKVFPKKVWSELGRH